MRQSASQVGWRSDFKKFNIKREKPQLAPQSIAKSNMLEKTE